MKNIVFIFVLLIISSLFAQVESLNVTLASHASSERAFCVEVKDNIAYVGSYDLLVFDITDPYAPELITTIPSTARVEFITIEDSLLFTAPYHFGMYVFDISDPYEPREITWWNGGDFTGIDVQGNYAYLGNEYTRGLSIVNISDFDDIYEEAFVPGSWWPENVTVSGNYSYVSYDYGGMSVVDISRPSSPIEVCRYVEAHEVCDVIVKDTIAYLASNRDGVELCNVAYPPVPVGIPSAIGNSTRTVEVYDNYIFVGDRFANFSIYDIRHTTFPRIGHYRNHDSLRTICDICASGNFAYCACSFSGFYIFDISYFTADHCSPSFSPGWNLFSVPLEDINKNELSDDSSVDLYDFNAIERCYENEDTIIIPGVGYWYMSDSSMEPILYGSEPLESLSLALYPGWNLIGTPNVRTPVSYLTSYSSIILPCYTYDNETGEYITAGQLEPLKAYWILSDDSTSISLP